MRFWTLHPSLLDWSGLIACWREAAGAFKALTGESKRGGYQNHPQLQRFKDTDEPVKHFIAWLYGVYEESLERGYSFHWKKEYSTYLPDDPHKDYTTWTTRGQLLFEIAHLKHKIRYERKQLSTKALERIQEAQDNMVLFHQSSSRYAHPLCKVREAEIEVAPWEKGLEEHVRKENARR